VATGDVAVSGGVFRVFKDAWGQPICFERFTTSPDVNQRPYATTFTPRGGVTTIDPLDPMFKLGDATYWDATRKALSESATVSGMPAGVMPPLPPGGPTGYTPAGFYTFNNTQNRMCALISFGPNKQMDADPITGDDLYSYRLHRPGNKGD